MIKINFRGKDRVFEDCDKMVEKLNIEPLTEEDKKFIKAKSRKAETIYAGLSPYAAELFGENVIVMRDTAEGLYNYQCMLREEV